MDAVTKATIEKREADTLAPYAMKSRDTRGREHDEPEAKHRSVYQRDRDRIIHSTAFRRLEYKTQVFVNHEGDYYRTRLTHTVEVAQIARSIARALGANEDLVEAIALAHDIGHTPFGHSGEEALNELMEGFGGFEHNIHGLRVVTKLERQYPGFRGLNLSWEVRESIVKHRTAYDKPYHPDYEPNRRPLIESQIVDMADSIAYNNHDLDDGIKAGILKTTELEEIDIWREARARVEASGLHMNDRVMARQTVRALINLEVIDLIETSIDILNSKKIASAADVQDNGEYLVAFSKELDGRRMRLQKYLYDHVYKHYRVIRMQRKAARFLTELFEAYRKFPDQMPPDHHADVAAEGLERAVADYIAGMTDRYAQDEYKRLFHPYERV